MSWLWVALAAVVLVLGATAPVLLRRNRRADSGREAIAARACYARLRFYVANPETVDDPEAARLLRQARERWDSAGAVLATAKRPAGFELAERIAREGIDAVAAAYERLGRPDPRT